MLLRWNIHLVFDDYLSDAKNGNVFESQWKMICLPLLILAPEPFEASWFWVTALFAHFSQMRRILEQLLQFLASTVSMYHYAAWDASEQRVAPLSPLYSRSAHCSHQSSRSASTSSYPRNPNLCVFPQCLQTPGWISLKRFGAFAPYMLRFSASFGWNEMSWMYFLRRLWSGGKRSSLKPCGEPPRPLVGILETKSYCNRKDLLALSWGKYPSMRKQKEERW